MRILLIAYEFPPSPSPQSLRWAYLSRELALLGHDVHVLTIDLGGATPGLPDLPAGVTVHRSHAGPLRSYVARRRKRRQLQAAHACDHNPGPAPARAPTPAWKQFISTKLQRFAEQLWFPDLRGEWLRPGRRALTSLLEQLHPDIVLSSHEPATTLELGLLARRAGYPWVADLGDPVLAPYTPRRWRKRALALERDVCAEADAILVTADTAAELLVRRHGRDTGIHLLTQGFDDRNPTPVPARAGTTFDRTRLELLYTGSFYSFRRAEALIMAIAGQPGIRLNIAAIVAPPYVRDACREYPDNFRLLGFLPHDQVLQLQREADALVSIANRDGTQVPGKLYEYLGAGRPILHLYNGSEDAAARMIGQMRRGLTSPNDHGSVSAQLARLAQAKQQNRLHVDFDLDPGPARPYAWRHLAQGLEAILVQAQRAAAPAGS